MEEKIIACNNRTCIKSKKCERHYLFKNGAKEFTTNSGNPNKDCNKFLLKTIRKIS